MSHDNTHQHATVAYEHVAHQQPANGHAVSEAHHAASEHHDARAPHNSHGMDELGNIHTEKPTLSFAQIVVEAAALSTPAEEVEAPKAPVHKVQLKPWLYKSFIGLDRVRGLSDAVLAIVITLLVVELRVKLPPLTSHDETTAAMLELWKPLLAYFAAVFIIGVTWLSHVYTFAAVQGSDVVLSVLNLTLLFWQCCIPFGISVIVEWTRLFYATVLLNVILIMMSTTLLFMWFYIIYGRRFVHGNQHFPVKFMWVVTLRYLFSPIVYSISLAVAAFNFWASIALTLLVPSLSLVASMKFDIFKLVVDVIFYFKEKNKKKKVKKQVEVEQQQHQAGDVPKQQEASHALTVKTGHGEQQQQHGEQHVKKRGHYHHTPHNHEEKKFHFADANDEIYISSKSFHGKVLDRIKVFSDAVFSIVLTILVLELRAPHASHDPKHEQEHLPDSELNRILGSKLLHMWPTYLSLILSFALVGSFWKVHSLILRGIHLTERSLLYVNTIFLAMVSLVPLAAEIVAEYHYLTISPIIFNLLMAVIGFLLLILHLEANWKGRLKHHDHKLSRVGMITGTLKIMLVPTVHLIAIGLAFVQVYVSTGIAILVPTIDLILSLNLNVFQSIPRTIVAAIEKCYKVLCCKKKKKQQHHHGHGVNYGSSDEEQQQKNIQYTETSSLLRHDQLVDPRRAKDTQG